MAIGAILRRRLVKKNGFCIYYARQFVAIATGDVTMRPRQREDGPLVVIEERRFPASAVVAFGTGGYPACPRELRAVDVFVAVLTFRRRRAEIHVDELGLQVRRLVAIHASHRAMLAEQGKVRLAMVETGEIPPILSGMAGLAAKCSASNHPPHAVAKFSVMRIVVTGGAGEVLKVKESGLFRVGREFHRLVAFRAGYGEVRAGEQESRLLVLRQPERRGPISIQSVALLAPVQVGSGGELPLVFILMAIETALELDLVERFLAVRNVALCALQAGMFPLQGVGSGCMLLQAKGARLETLHGVAGTALASIGALGELALMLILVAMHALLKSQRLFEIAAAVALQAIDFLVLAEQRIFRLRVIEIPAKRGS